MANKWEICIDVDEEGVDALCEGLNRLRVRAEGPWIADLIAQIRLAWIEREVEIIPPPNKWSAHSPVAVGHDVLRS